MLSIISAINTEAATHRPCGDLVSDGCETRNFCSLCASKRCFGWRFQGVRKWQQQRLQQRSHFFAACLVLLFIFIFLIVVFCAGSEHEATRVGGISFGIRFAVLLALFELTVAVAASLQSLSAILQRLLLVAATSPRLA